MTTTYRAMRPCKINGVDYLTGDIVSGDGIAAASLKYLTPPDGGYLEPYYGSEQPKKGSEADDRETSDRSGEGSGEGRTAGEDRSGTEVDAARSDGRSGGARPIQSGAGKRG